MERLPLQRFATSNAAVLICGGVLLLAWPHSLAAFPPEGRYSRAQVADKLTLDECIAIALENQPAVQAQRAAKCAALERQRVAGSFFLPQLGFRAHYTHVDEPRTVDISSPFGGEVGDVFSDAAAYFGLARQYGSAFADAALDNPSSPPFSVAKQMALDRLPDRFNVGLLGENSLATEILLVQPLWTGGKIRYRHQQAQLGVQVVSADEAKSKQQTAFDVTQGYLGEQVAGELVGVMKAAIGHLRAMESLIQGLLDEGNPHVTMADLHRVRAVRLLFESDQVGAKQGGKLAHELLRQAMGLSYAAEFEIADPRLAVCRRRVELPAILSEAMARRPELTKARLAVRIAELERQLAAADYLPDIGLFGRFGTIDDDGGFPNPNDREEWAVGMTLEVPLYAGGRRPAQTRQARFEQARACHVRELASQLIRLEVQKAYLEYMEMSERLPLVEAAAYEADTTVAKYWNQFRGDQIADEAMPDFFEDLTNAEVLRLLASARYYNVVYQHGLSFARIRLVSASHEYDDFSGDSLPIARLADTGRASGESGDGAGPKRSPLFKHYDRDRR